MTGKQMNWAHRVDLIVATFCCVLVGVIKGLFYLIVPWFLALFMTFYALRFLAEFFGCGDVYPSQSARIMAARAI